MRSIQSLLITKAAFTSALTGAEAGVPEPDGDYHHVYRLCLGVLPRMYGVYADLMMQVAEADAARTAISGIEFMQLVRPVLQLFSAVGQRHSKLAGTRTGALRALFRLSHTPRQTRWPWSAQDASSIARLLGIQWSLDRSTGDYRGEACGAAPIRFSLCRSVRRYALEALPRSSCHRRQIPT